MTFDIDKDSFRGVVRKEEKLDAEDLGMEEEDLGELNSFYYKNVACFFKPVM